MVKQRIIEEASELFGRSGVKSITMDDLARHLGISKRTIYENFKDKENLLIACIDALYEEAQRKKEKIFLAADNMVKAILIMLQTGEQWQFNMINDIRKYYPLVYKEHLLRFHNDECRNMEQTIRRGINEGFFRGDLNPEIIAHFFCRQGENVDDKALNRFAFSDIIENIAITFLRGICTAKGIEIIDKYKKTGK